MLPSLPTKFNSKITINKDTTKKISVNNMIIDDDDENGDDNANLFSLLPPEIQLHIFTFLQLKDILNVSLINHYLYSLSSTNTIWRLLYQQQWNCLPREGSSDFLESFNDKHFSLSSSSSSSSSSFLFKENKQVKHLFFNKHLLEKNWMTSQYSISTFKAHEHAINALKFITTSHTSTLVTCSDDNTVKSF